ncbi:MAG: Ig-like domain-containing protein, partial [Aureispira sp.]|nr:Ig-like domain-containing protein [Aureispira sp.]
TITSGQNGFAVSNSVNSIYAEGNKVYAGTNGGISISSDGGASWTTITSGQNGFAVSNSVNSIYAEGNKVYAGTNGGISISSDGGATWTIITSGQNGFANSASVNEVYVDGSITYAGTYNGLSILGPFSSLSDNVDNTADNQIQGATTNELMINNLTIDSDSSEYFVRVSKEGCTQQSNTVLLSVVEAPFITKTTPNNNEGDVAVTSNIEIAFSELITKGTGNIIIKNAADSSVVETISVVSSTISDSTLIIDPNLDLDFTTTYFVQLDSGIVIGQNTSHANLVSLDVLSFTTVCPNLIPTDLINQSRILGDSVTFFVDEVDGATYEWYRSNKNWATTTANQNGFAGSNTVYSTYAEGNKIYAGTSAGLSISSDGGSSWITTTSGQNGFASSNTVLSVYAEGNKIYAGTSAGLSISSDKGSSWITTTSGQNSFASSNTVYSTYAEGNKIYAGTSAGLSISSDGGSSWITTTSGQ